MGREFLELFEQWAGTYDDTVEGQDEEYKEVFRNYDLILEEVAKRSFGHVMEFGVGTGNLTQKLLSQGLVVTGIEPSPSMRKIAEEKLAGKAKVIDGDFQSFPVIEGVETIVSSYAFHHLTNDEKSNAASLYGKLLPKGGKIVFADTMYESGADYQNAISNARQNGFHSLADDLEREYYTTIPILRSMFEKNGFLISFSRCNDFVWLMEGTKQ